MSRKMKMVLIATGVAFAASAGFASMAADPATKDTPFNYRLDKDGNKVPKGNTVTNADGSTREEIRRGGCVEIKEKSTAGEIKITRKCD